MRTFTRVWALLPATLLALGIGGCASSSATNEVKQSELSRMEKAGQRNNDDKPFGKSDGGY